MKAQTYMLSNLNCPNCAAKLERAVTGIEGVKESRVSFGTGALAVQYDEAVVDEGKIRDTVHRFNLEISAVLQGRVK